MPTPIGLFDYKLPEELIASRPAEKRDLCRLMVVDKVSGDISRMVFKEILNLLDDSCFLVVNNTRVRNARLEAKKPTGGRSELFVTELLPSGGCKALVRGSFKPGQELLAAGKRVVLLERDSEGLWLIDNCGTDIESLMEVSGHVPLPPYIDRPDEPSDKVDYQTVYSKESGSAAAPTAGLHFTEELLAAIRMKGIEIVEVTLDVGLGTFRPVKTATLEEHNMHSETYRITDEGADKINSLKSIGKRLVAVGSTAVRTLEAAAECKGRVKAGPGAATLLIVPGYDFMMVDEMITNFHLPKSTLLAMVSALGGYDLIMESYKRAVEERYRFFSYGDAMFIRNH